MHTTTSDKNAPPLVGRRTAREIIAYCNRLLEDDPDRLGSDLLAKIYVERGAAYASMGDLASAKRDFQTATHYKDDFASAYNNLAGILIREGNFADALEQACRAVTIDPYEPDNNLMVAHEGKRMSDKIAHSPTATLYYKRAILYETQRVYERARDDLLQAVERDPDFAAAWSKLGDVYQKLGEPEKAAEAYDLLADRAHDYPFQENQLALAKYWTHRMRKIACNGTADDYADVGALFVMQETLPAFTRARTYLRGALERNPAHPAALYNLSVVETLLNQKGHINLDAEQAVAAGQVPDVVGAPKQGANRELRQAGYRPRAIYRKVDDESRHGLVIQTQPAAGSALEAGNIVEIVIGHPGLSLESLEGIGPAYRQKLTAANVSTLNLLTENPTIGDAIAGLSAARTTRWANMAQWILAYADEMDGNAVELLVVGVGIPSPEAGFEQFAGQSVDQIKATLRAAAQNVKLPAGYLDQNLDRLAALLATLN